MVFLPAICRGFAALVVKTLFGGPSDVRARGVSTRSPRGHYALNTGWRCAGLVSARYWRGWRESAAVGWFAVHGAVSGCSWALVATTSPWRPGGDSTRTAPGPARAPPLPVAGQRSLAHWVCRGFRLSGRDEPGLLGRVVVVVVVVEPEQAGVTRCALRKRQN